MFSPTSDLASPSVAVAVAMAVAKPSPTVASPGSQHLSLPPEGSEVQLVPSNSAAAVGRDQVAHTVRRGVEQCFLSTKHTFAFLHALCGGKSVAGKLEHSCNLRQSGTLPPFEL